MLASEVKIFAIIVTHNGQQYVEKCISSLAHSSCEIKIVVIDNDSRDDTVRLLKTKWPQVVLFELDRNLGFGKANNIGLRYAYENGAAHMLLLNQDAWVHPRTVEALAELQKTNPGYGVLSPLHLDGSGQSLDTHFGQFVGRSEDIGKLLSTILLKRPMREVYPVDFVNAAIWMLSRECVETVGLFNPAFIHYGEDLDYVHRLGHFGYRIGICPSWYAVHDRDQHSIGEVRPFDETHLLRIKAEIIRRLSRLYPKTAFNLASVLAYTLLSAQSARPSARVRTYLDLTAFIIFNIRAILKNRSIARLGGLCFSTASQRDETASL